MTRCCGHSEICLLNIILQMITSIHSAFDRSLLDISGDVDQYLSSWDREFEKLTLGLIAILGQMLGHECHGEDIRKCDPNEPIFSVHTKEN